MVADGVDVGVRVGARVAVTVAVGVAVSVGVAVAVAVAVGVAVLVCVAVGVAVAVGASTKDVNRLFDKASTTNTAIAATAISHPALDLRRAERRLDKDISPEC